jgi:uncharacterized DUF497 family protein
MHGGPLGFEWDESKANSNQHKHGVSFAEARSVFLDEQALLIPDAKHSDREDRFVLLGRSDQLRVLIVCHCYRREAVIRIISARRANRSERRQYEGRYPS